MTLNSLRADSSGGNVVRLPTAAPRQVRNPVRAIRAYRAANPWPGTHLTPAQADARRTVQGLSAAEIVVTAILESLPHDIREAAQNRVYWLNYLTHDPLATRAAVLVANAGKCPRAPTS